MSENSIDTGYNINEKTEQNKNSEVNQLPVISIGSGVFFPDTLGSVDLTKDKSKSALEDASYGNGQVFLVAQKNEFEENPDLDGFYKYGVVCNVIKSIKISQQVTKVLVECQHTAILNDISKREPFLLGNVKRHRYDFFKNKEEEAVYIRRLFEKFQQYAVGYIKVTPELMIDIKTSKDINKSVNIVAHLSNFTTEQKIELLAETDPKVRCEKTLYYLEKEMYSIDIEKEIDLKTKVEVENNHREFILKEKIKIINKELGNTQTIDQEIEKYREKIKEIKPPEYVIDRVEEEISRLLTGVSMQENGMIRDFISRVLELPWGEHQKTTLSEDLVQAQKVLDDEHFGLDKVKERIIEYLAVEQYAKNKNSSIICLVGPPGVGKTSIAKSIAHATNRKSTRISLGGVKDESEIRGHRKTYLGAMTGRVINAFKLTGVNNPLIVFDEIDKMSSDHKGDPASAMLEVLDPEQNKEFRDNYLELPFDLSRALFICTANDIRGIPQPLIDRMEIINLSTYSVDEKIEIAKKYLIKKQMKAHNLTKDDLSIPNNMIKTIVNNFTQEAGVRNLEKAISKICRKVVVLKLTDKEFKKVIITNDNIEEYLGIKRELKKVDIKKDEVGKVIGLAYTAYGGTVLPIESVCYTGTGKVDITGNIGKVMTESSRVALNYLKANAKKFNIDKIDLSKIDIALHFPEGATPKDGPSAGVAITLSYLSVLTNKKVKANVAMTGEISMLGNVLPIGGIKEKLLSGKNYGIKNFLVPIGNKSDVEDLDKELLKGLNITYLSKFEDAVKICL